MNHDMCLLRYLDTTRVFQTDEAISKSWLCEVDQFIKQQCSHSASDLDQLLREIEAST